MKRQKELSPVENKLTDDIAVLREMVRLHGPRAAAAIAVELAELRCESEHFQKFTGRFVVAAVFEDVLATKSVLSYVVSPERAEKELVSLDENITSRAFLEMGFNSEKFKLALGNELEKRKTIKPKSHFSHKKSHHQISAEGEDFV